MTLFLRDPTFSFGNDIVDLREESDRSVAFLDRYVRRICTEREAAFVREEPDLAPALWKVWALKESAYKAVNRQDCIRAFRYRELEVQPGFDGVLDHGTGRSFCSFVRANVEFVFAVAWNGGPRPAAVPNDSFLVSWIDRVNETEDLSKAVRSQVLQILEQMGHEFHEDPIKRPVHANGLLCPPLLDLPNGSAPVSLSHHGRMVMTTCHMRSEAAPVLARRFVDRHHIVSGRRIFLLSL